MKKFRHVFLLFSLVCCSATVAQETKTIYFMRVKQVFCSGVKMDVRVNDKSVYKLKSGNRLILTVNSSDTIKINCVYPLIKKYQSKPCIISPTDDNEIYLNVFYQGEGYNPLKHSGVLLGPNGSPVKLGIEIERLELAEGERRFYNEKQYKDGDNIRTIEQGFQ